MTIKKKSLKQFEIDFQQRLIEKRTFYQEMSTTIFERRKLDLKKFKKNSILLVGLKISQELQQISKSFDVVGLNISQKWRLSSMVRS
jgi:hypothetical protein